MPLKLSPLVVVEPHSDDAFLSLGAHIEQWTKEGRDVKIVTLIPVKPRSFADAEAYARAVGADWEGYDCGREMKNADGFYVNPHTLILPLGIVHADHIAVRHVCERQWVGPYGATTWYYLDQPYASVLKNRERVNALLTGMEVVSYAKPPARKWRHIPIFTAQAKFFHFNPKEKLAGTVELIVKRKEKG